MHLTYSNVTASLALFIALGGTSYAVTKIPKNSVGSNQVRDGSLQRKDLRKNVSVRGARGIRGPAGPLGPQGERGPSNVRIAGQLDVIPLTGQEGQPKLVRRMDDVPAGAWLLYFDATAELDAATALHTRCALKVNGDAKAHGAVVVGDAANGVREAPVVVTTAVQQASPFNVTVECLQTLSSNPPVEVVHPQIIATQVGQVTTAP